MSNVATHYFNAITEKAVVEYQLEKDQQKRDYIFNAYLLYPISKIVEVSYNKSKDQWSYISDSKTAQDDCLTHLVTKTLPSFKPAKKTKAYSYLTVSARHFFMQLNKREYKYSKRSTQLSFNDETADGYVIPTTKGTKDRRLYLQTYVKLAIEFWTKDRIARYFNSKKQQKALAVVLDYLREERYNGEMAKDIFKYLRNKSGIRTTTFNSVFRKLRLYHKFIYRYYQDTGELLKELPDITPVWYASARKKNR